MIITNPTGIPSYKIQCAFFLSANFEIFYWDYLTDVLPVSFTFAI